MRASSDAITMSAQSAISLPPPTHQPCTWAITGFGLRHSDMKRGTQPVACEVTDQVAPGIPFAVRRDVLVPVREAVGEVEAGTEGAAGSLEGG